MQSFLSNAKEDAVLAVLGIDSRYVKLRKVLATAHVYMCSFRQCECLGMLKDRMFYRLCNVPGGYCKFT